MNVLLLVLQVLLALHTVTGAMWKFFNSPQTVPSLTAIPQGAWLSLSVFELLCSLGLILPAFSKPLGIFAPIAAACIAAEMFLFTGVAIHSGDVNYGQVTYWLVVAAICAFIGYGKIALRPLGPV